MQALFKSEEFKKASAQSDTKERRELIGNTIYETVEKIVGADTAPKITGMIIDLPEQDLVPTIYTLENLQSKALDASRLLNQLQQQPPSAMMGGAAGAPIVPASK